MASILCVALNPSIDLANEAARVVPTKKVRTRNQRQNIGGGGVNVARVLAEMGDRCELLVLAGGATGQVFLDAVRKLPVDLHTITTAGATRIAFMVKDMETGDEYRFVPEGPLITPDEYQQVHRYLSQGRWDYVVLSGSLPRGVPDHAYAQLTELLADRDTRIILDTSGSALKEALRIGGLFMIKPSLDELEGIVGQSLTEETAVAKAQELIAGGAVQHVCLSLGRQGAMLVSANQFLKLPSFPVKVGSTVGAGDSFVGGMLWGLIHDYPVEEAFRLGVSAGAATVMSEGTDLCRREDVFALYLQGSEGLTADRLAPA
jgi:hexose kinase, 1-phosphofructokinase family